MAAHILTALGQIEQRLEDSPVTGVYWNQLQGALDASTWAEDLSLREYRVLCKIVSLKATNALYEWQRKLRRIYQTKWINLNCPPTREDWHKMQEIIYWQ